MSANVRPAWIALRVALAVLEAGGAVALLMLVMSPAAAQMRDDRYPFLERRQPKQAPQQQVDPFGAFPGPGYFYDRRPRGTYSDRGQPADSSKAPPARKPDTAPTTVIAVLGDSMADWLAYGLEEAFADNSDFGFVRKIRSSSGLIRNESRSDAFDWTQAGRDLLGRDKADFIVMMTGVADRQAIRERATSRSGSQSNEQAAPGSPTPGQTTAAPDETPIVAEPGSSSSNLHEFRSEKWTELYSKRIDDTIASLKSKGVPIIWVGLPAIRGARSKTEVVYLNDLYRSRAEKAGITYVDVWDGFIDEDGNFAVHGPDYNGQIRRLRTGDGVHFTQAGALKLAHYVEREIQRLMAARTTVALPEPQSQPQLPAVRPGPQGPRPVAGPVVPLTGKPVIEDLAGAAATIPPAIDPIANRVLIRGETVPAPTGRADDFAWPRRDSVAEINELAPIIPPTQPAAAPRAGQQKATPPAEQRPTQKRPGQAAANPAQRQVR